MSPSGEKTDRDGRTKADMDAKPQTEEKHPDEWEEELNPNRMAGQNIGASGSEGERDLPTAHEMKDVHRRLRDDFTDDELKKIPVLEQGQRLQQGATYLNLNDPEREEFKAMGGRETGSTDRMVPKADVPYSLWNRLRGVEEPERLAERNRKED